MSSFLATKSHDTSSRQLEEISDEEQVPPRISELCVALLLGAISFQLTGCGRGSAGAAEPTAPEVEVVTSSKRISRSTASGSEPWTAW